MLYMQQQPSRFSDKISGGLKDLDYSQQENRIFLSDAYRKLQKLVNKRHNFNTRILEDDDQDKEDDKIDYIRELMKYSQGIKPYMETRLEEGENVYEGIYDRTLGSKLFLENFVGNRKCLKIKVTIDGDIQSGNHIKIYGNSTFHLSLESQPNSVIIYTTNGKHPMLVQDQSQKITVEDRAQLTFEYPCVICAIAVSNDNQKMQSQFILIQADKKQKNDQVPKGHQQTIGMVRPSRYFNFLDSSSSQSVNENFMNIQSINSLGSHQ